MKQLLFDNRFFLIPYLSFLGIFLFFAVSYSKIEMHIWVNQINSPFFDEFFKIYTHLGDGITIAVVSIILIFLKYRYAIVFLFASLVTSGIVHLFKKWLLDELHRPWKYFELYETYKLTLIDGIHYRGFQTFPSGHAATAFNVFFFLAILTKNNYLKLGYFILAFLVACSRVYLSMHFFIDTVAGSFIAIIMVLLIYKWSLNWDRKWMESSVKLNL